MHTHWLQQSGTFLRSREGRGTLLLAACSAIALGVVPNLLEKAWDSGWFFAGVFVSTILLAVLGWVLRLPRGVGVVLQLFSPDAMQEGRLEALKAASARNHSSTLLVKPRMLRPGRMDLPPRARMDLVASLIDARVIEDIGPDAGADGGADVTLYPLAHLSDGFLLGQCLADFRGYALTVMHVSGADGRTVVPGVVLDGSLAADLGPQREALVRNRIDPTPGAGDVQPVPHPECPPEHQRRLALIVRLTGVDAMIDDACEVARTGRVRRPSGGLHTGYVFDRADSEADGLPCGAHLVIRSTGGRHLDESRDTFEAIAKHIHQTYVTARDAWKTACGGGSIETRIFVAAPLPIVIALGYLMRHENAEVVHHDKDLLNKPVASGVTS
ncbi:hypothetical protein [Streptomyces albogriseolus]|uniref:hypothetical protein n=1 Tax=Streptomyces albogriseolus TaxID=1887 RepID=UPI0036B2AD7C